jgi:deoxycytidylate deaminase
MYIGRNPHNATLATREILEQYGFTPKYTLEKDYSDCPSGHAETNAISRSNFESRQGATLYVTSDVCIPCAKIVANSGIKRVVVDDREPHPHRNSEASYEFLKTCHIEVVLLH